MLPPIALGLLKTLFLTPCSGEEQLLVVKSEPAVHSGKGHCLLRECSAMSPVPVPEAVPAVGCMSQERA